MRLALSKMESFKGLSSIRGFTSGAFHLGCSSSSAALAERSPIALFKKTTKIPSSPQTVLRGKPLSDVRQSLPTSCFLEIKEKALEGHIESARVGGIGEGRGSQNRGVARFLSGHLTKILKETQGLAEVNLQWWIRSEVNSIK